MDTVKTTKLNLNIDIELFDTSEEETKQIVGRLENDTDNYNPHYHTLEKEIKELIAMKMESIIHNKHHEPYNNGNRWNTEADLRKKVCKEIKTETQTRLYNYQAFIQIKATHIEGENNVI